jgi:hypothetical protein
MHVHRIPVCGLAAAIALGCAPDLAPSASSPCAGEAAPPGTTLEVTLQPAAPPDEAPPIAHFVVRARDPEGAPVSVDPQRLALVEGEIGAAHLRQIEEGAISGALSERIVPALIWPAEDAVVLAPSQPLEPGASYAIASGSPPESVALAVLEEDALPQLALWWPPDGASSGPRLGIWCGSEPLVEVAQPVVLGPTGEEATLLSGAIGAAGRHCVHLEPASAALPEPAAPPPAIVLPDERVVARLDPTPLAGSAEASAAPAPVACEPGEVAFGPSCARVADDRLWLSATEVPLLWAISGGALDAVIRTGPGAPALVSPLPPSSSLALLVETLDVNGQATQATVPIVTLPPMAHVVINEVLANPVGEEPEQEWVELYNDGLAPADLAGYVLSDIGGEEVLPGALLAPGAYALVVNEAFDEQSEHDPMPEPGTLILRVESVGKNGLSNEGEPLKLLDAGGTVVSRFPAAPKPKAGRSVIRIHPKAVDELESSFMLCAVFPSPGSVNLMP